MRALLLSGGGAKAAFQAGVLRHLQELSQAYGNELPFEILVGVSAGAINLAALANQADHFEAAVQCMYEKWEKVTTAAVFDIRLGRVFMNVLRWLMTLSSGGASEQIGTRVKSLLDTKPLAKLIRDLMQPYRIQEHLDKGLLEGIAVSATCYDSGDLTVFIQTGLNQTVWRRFSRLAKRSFITPEHILASCALPILFPAVKIQERFYGDGSIRNMAPLSPAIHLGAERILAIGVREQLGESESPPPPAANPDSRYPSLAGISGLLLDSIFLDALESDRENMERINRLSGLLPRQLKPGRKEWFRQIKFLYIGPSKRLSLIAQKHQQALPRTLKYMLRGLGLKADSGGELLSYLLFESAYCQELLALGYEVARSRSDEIKSFLWEDG